MGLSTGAGTAIAAAFDTALSLLRCLRSIALVQ